jgi:chromate transport protein ChrA
MAGRVDREHNAFASLVINHYSTNIQYQELFAICQSLPGPASTKMAFCITYMRGGLLAAIASFLMWR